MNKFDLLTFYESINNGFALKNWPEPEAWARLVAEDLGLREVQFSFDLLDPTLQEPARRMLIEQTVQTVKEFGISIRTTFTGLIIYAQNHLAHPDAGMRTRAFSWFESALEATARLGAEATGGHIGAMSSRDSVNRHSFIRATLIDSVRALTRTAAALGQEYFLWEFMPTPREIPHTPDEALELVREVNVGASIPVRLCFDLGHCCGFDLKEPGDPHDWLQKVLPLTPIVHLQQTDGRGDHHWPFTPEFNRSGIIDPRRVVEIVKTSPFERVDLVLELGHSMEVSEQQIIDDHKRSIDFWTKWL